MWSHVVGCCLAQDFLLPIQIINNFGAYVPGNIRLKQAHIRGGIQASNRCPRIFLCIFLGKGFYSRFKIGFQSYMLGNVLRDVPDLTLELEYAPCCRIMDHVLWITSFDAGSYSYISSLFLGRIKDASETS